MENEPIEGQILAEKYRVERVLGRGGMGIVVAAHHLQLDEKVALKFLLPEAVKNADIVGRFVREARAAVRIKSEHVARVSDVGTLASGAPYMVMEYLEGSDLAAWVRQHGALPIEQAVEFVLQAGEAVAEAHALGIVHRDLKPANLFVVRRADGLLSVKVLDFGISKVTPMGAAGTNVTLTQTATIMGSPLYMPPEQMAASKSVDARADIWALGIILYELMAGVAPFAGETLPEVCMKIAIEAPRPIRELCPDVSEELEAVVLRCLEKDREQRFSNVAELALALIDFGPKRARSSVDRITGTIHAAGLLDSPLSVPPSSGRRAGTPVGSALSAGTGTEAPWGRTAGGSGKSKSTQAAVLIGALLAVALAGLTLGVAHWLRASPPAAGSARPALAAQSSPPSAQPHTLVAPSPAPSMPAAPSVPELGAAPDPYAAAPEPQPVFIATKLRSLPRGAPAIKHVRAASTAPPSPRPEPKANIFDER